MAQKNFEQSEAVLTGDGTYSLKHPTHGELFHSFSGAALEARDLYLGASSIKQAWQAGCEVAVLDVGLGLGYNALVTLSGFLAQPIGTLNLVSLEIERELVELLCSGAANWQSGWPQEWLALVKQVSRVSEQEYLAEGERWSWRILCGDALHIEIPGKYNYIWQDPFSPTKNPTMWSEVWFKQLLPLTYPQTELLSYSVSRSVKDALHVAGWQYERIPTTTTKRHWLRAAPASTI
jgi:tRNA U34 5-methylaminomethyl-2-thiouridine-forming methyltransferase MnmC